MEATGEEKRKKQLEQARQVAEEEQAKREQEKKKKKKSGWYIYRKEISKYKARFIFWMVKYRISSICWALPMRLWLLISIYLGPLQSFVHQERVQ